MQSNSVLFVSLNGDPSAQIVERLNRADITVSTVASLSEAEEKLLSRDYVVCLLRTAGTCDAPLKLISFCRQHTIGTKHIVSVSRGVVEDAVRVVKAGAHDFLVGDISDARVIESILREATNYRENPKPFPKAQSSPGELSAVLVGQSSGLWETAWDFRGSLWLRAGSIR